MPSVTLRERKKLRTRAAISEAAVGLFLEHGFDQVSISRIAEEAEVSRRTLFAYFPTKEDLVVQVFADHETESARVVRARPEGRTPLAALRAHFLDGLRDRDPITGLCDRREVLGLFRLMRETPSLMARFLRFRDGAERSLAAALHETADTPALVSRLAAAQIASVQWALALANNNLLSGGVSADQVYPRAVEAAEQGFALLADGLGSLW